MSTDPGKPNRLRALSAAYRPGPVLLILIVANALIELGLQAADLGWIGSPSWRGIAYHNGAFWAGLLDNWRPNYPLQPGLMFVSYAFLHGGLGHLTGNMLMLYVLGTLVRERAGQGALIAIYFVATVAGGIGFAALGENYQPMVGASGALFGLAGAWKVWELKDRRHLGLTTWPVIRDVAGLVLLNVVMWYMLEGLLAWEAHLGGFLGGAIMAAFLGGRNVPTQ